MRFYRKSPYAWKKFRVKVEVTPEDIELPKEQEIMTISEVALYNIKKYLKEKLHLSDEEIALYLEYKLCQERSERKILRSNGLGGIAGLGVIASLDQIFHSTRGFSIFNGMWLVLMAAVMIHELKNTEKENYYTPEHCALEGIGSHLLEIESAYFAYFDATEKANKQKKLGLHG